MPRYLIERTVPGAGQMDAAGLAAIAGKSNGVLRDLGPDVQWLRRAYVTDDKITCVYLAANEDLVREHGALRRLPDRRGARGPSGHRSRHRRVGGVVSVGKAVVSLTTGLEDAEKVTVALLVAVGAAESGRPTRMFLTKEAVRLATTDFAVGVACDGCPPIADLVARYAAAGGDVLVCPICFDARRLDRGSLVANAEVGGTVPLWEWIGDGATTFSPTDAGHP